MASDEFFDQVDKEVFIANAKKLSVSVRYANTSQGSTSSGSFKVEVPGSVSCSTNSGYGFQRWAAFSSADFDSIQYGLIYKNKESYDADFGIYELPSSVVTFANAESTSTEVTIHEERSVVLVPICSEWLEYKASIPENNATGVVRNSSINIRFSGPVKNDEANLKNNVKISQGQGDFYNDGEDITDWFDMTLSENGEILTCKLTGSNKYTAGEKIIVKISAGLQGANKNTRSKEEARFVFSVGTGEDTVPPEIVVLTAGIANAYTGFASEASGENPATPGALSTYKTKRAKDKVNIYVRSTDKTSAGATATESNVLNAKVRSTLVIGADGVAIGDPPIEKTDTHQYSPAKSFVSGIANPATSTGGTVFAYDISGVEDGLVRIDVATTDNNGNTNGFDETTSAYKSLFVIRDNTPPDITTQTSKVKLQSSGAEYGWFNETTLATVSATLDDPTNKIVDGGTNANLRAADDDMQWAFTLGSDASAWTPEESEWGSATSAKTLTTASATEGSSEVLMALRDDVGNMSSVAKLDATLNYDKTAPELKPLSWLDDGGNAVNLVTDANVIEEYLAIPFTEALSGVREIDIKVEGTSVIDGDTEFYYSATGNFAAKTNLGTRNGAVATGYSELPFTAVAGSQKAGYTTGTLYVKKINLGLASSSSYENVLTINVNDAALNSTAAATPSGAQTISVYHDSTPPALDKIEIPNVVPSKYYGESNSRYYFGEDELNAGQATVKLSITENASGIKVIDFTGSDITPTASSTIKFGATELASTDFAISGGNITFTTIGQIADTTQFVIEITNCAIQNIAPISSSEANKISIKVTDFADLPSGTLPDGTPLEEATDGADTYRELIANKAAPLPVAIDSLQDRGTGDYAVEFAAADGFTNYEVVNATVTIPAKAANSAATKKLVLTGATFVKDGSTHNGVSNDTTVEISVYDESTDTYSAFAAYTDFTIDTTDEANDTITFTDAFATAVKLKLYNIKLTGGDGEKTVSVAAKSPSGNASAASPAKTITLDTSAPTLSEEGPYTVSTAGAEYPRVESGATEAHGLDTTAFGDTNAATNGDATAIRYFYTSGASREIKISVTDGGNTNCGIKLVNDLAAASAKASAITIAADYSDIQSPVSGSYTVTPDATVSSANPYTYVAVDKAGNVSKAYSFYVIQDAAVADDMVTAGGTHKSILSQTVLVEPATAHTHRNPAASGKKKYVIKNPANESEKYKIVVKLAGVTSSDKLVTGATADAANSAVYAELKPNASQSGLGAWAITKNGAAVKDEDWNTTFDANGNIEFFVNDYLETGVPTSLTLYLKDNCGNEIDPAIDIADGTDIIEWTVGGSAPNIEKLAPASALSSGTGVVTDTYEEGEGAEFGRTYIASGTTYFNDNAYLGIKYKADDYLFSTASAAQNSTNPASGYTVKARLYFTTTATAPTAAEITAASASSTTAVSDWYYFADETSAERTFYAKYPHLATGAEGTEGTLYILIEDTVGNSYVMKVTNSGADKFCYNNKAPTVTVRATDFVLSDTGKRAEIGTTKSYVHGDTPNPPQFDITIAPSASGTLKYKYATIGNDTGSTGYTTGADVSQVVPLGLLDEASSTATAKPIYLYIYDNVGNRTIKQIGNTWLKDSTAPATAADWASAAHTNPDNSYISQDADGKINVTIAGSTDTGTGEYSVYIPVSWFSDSGAGVYGLSLTANDVRTVSATIVNSATTNGDDCFELKIPASLRVAGTTKTGTYYVYDKVGNYSTAYTIAVSVDSKAPTVYAKFSVTGTGARLHSADLFTAEGGSTPAENGYDTTNGYKGTAYTEAYTETAHTSPDATKTLWTNTADVTLTINATDDASGIASITVTDTPSVTTTESGGTTTGTATLTATTTAKTYTITVTDKAGNTMVHKVALQLDNTPPTVTATATPNAGAKTKDDGTDVTLYYKTLKLNATIADGGIGVGAYKFGTSFTNTTPTTFSETNYTATDMNTAETITLTAHDELGNETKNTSWTYNSKTVTKFFCDNAAPTWNTTPINVARYGNVAGTWTDSSTDNSKLVSASTSGNATTITIKSNEDANIVISPNAVDGTGESGLVGFIVSTTNSVTPSADATYPNAKIVVACKAGSANGVSATADAGDGTGSLCGTPHVNFNLSGSDYTVYIFPVDNAGNVGTAHAITLTYLDVTPSVSDVGVSVASGSVVYPNPTSGTNYFNGGVSITATLSVQDSSNFPVKGYKLYKKNASDEYTEITGIDTTGGTYTATSATLDMPTDFVTSGNDELYIAFYNDAGESTREKVELNGSARWTKDNTAPSTPTAVELSAPTAGFHLKEESGSYTLYFKNKGNTVDLNFTATDTGGSTLKGVAASNLLNASGADSIKNPYTVTPKNGLADDEATTGSQTFYAYDNVLNVSDGLTIAYKQDVAGPTGTATISSGVYDDGTNIYYKPGGTVTIAISGVIDAGCGVVSGYKYSINGGTEVTLGNTFEIELGSASGTQNIVVYAYDILDNPGEIGSFTLIEDSDPPTVSVAADAVVGNGTVGTYSYTGGIFTFDNTTTEITITVTATDTGGSDVKEIQSTKGTVSGSTITITAPAEETTVTITATDNVDNPSTPITITLKPAASP